jgi:signal transduction histidine kinase
LEKDIPEFVLIDQERFSQILMNLIGNSVKFTLRGSVLLKALGRNEKS